MVSNLQALPDLDALKNIHLSDSANPELPLEQIHRAPPRAKPAAAQIEDHQTEGVYPVAEIQQILVALGWRGAGTTKGPLHAELRDGLYGPVTCGDWGQSARKRQLDTTCVRVDARHVHVDPHTYETLRAIAQSKPAVSGRMLRIP